MATVSYSCPECSKATQLHVGQSIFGGQLVWHSCYSCTNCGAVIEMDDEGVPPDYIRHEIIKTEGLWHLYVYDENRRQRLIAVREMRSALNIPFSEVDKLLKLIPGRVKSGTRAEMEWLKNLLLNKGINVGIVEEQ
jgi:DNA-directed RNA polymerase subunit RPC12/RpoP